MPKRSLVSWDQLFPWQEDNEFILTGYREASFSARRNLSSILELHNETVNTWSHVLGSLFYGYFLLFPDPAAPQPSDRVALSIYYASVVTCFVLSCTFHLLLNHSPEVREFALHLDHLGIVIVIWGSTIASTYFGFHCDALTRNTYFVLATTMGAAAASATFSPFLKTAAGRNLRCLAYALLGLTAFASASHGVLVNSWDEQNRRQSLSYFIGLAGLNGLGTIVYAVRVPERWFPRTFDICGSSHQILHVLVMLGAYSHSVGLHKALRYWQEQHGQLGNCS